MRTAAFGRHGYCLELPCEQFDAVRLDDAIDREGAAGLTLAIATMAAIHEHRRRLEPVTHRSAKTAAFEMTGLGHDHRSCTSMTPEIALIAPLICGVMVNLLPSMTSTSLPLSICRMTFTGALPPLAKRCAIESIGFESRTK